MLHWNRIARTGVLGKPWNRLAPDIPGKIIPSPQGNSSHSKIKSAGSVPLGNNKGQNGEDSHWGTMRVPLAPDAWACLITLGIKLTGGNNQLLSVLQLQVNASTASEPGAQNLVLNLSSWAFFALAYLSILCGPQTHLARQTWMD